MIYPVDSVIQPLNNPGLVVHAIQLRSLWLTLEKYVAHITCHVCFIFDLINSMTLDPQPPSPLGTVRHCESTLFYPRTQGNYPRQKLEPLDPEFEATRIPTHSVL